MADDAAAVAEVLQYANRTDSDDHRAAARVVLRATGPGCPVQAGMALDMALAAVEGASADGSLLGSFLGAADAGAGDPAQSQLRSRILSAVHIGLDAATVRRVQDAAGLGTRRQAAEKQRAAKVAARLDELAAAQRACKDIRRALDLLQPPLEPGRRVLLTRKAAFLPEATTPDNCAAPMAEFLIAADTALAAHPPARQYGRAVFLAWRHLAFAHEDMTSSDATAEHLAGRVPGDRSGQAGGGFGSRASMTTTMDASFFRDAFTGQFIAGAGADIDTFSPEYSVDDSLSDGGGVGPSHRNSGGASSWAESRLSPPATAAPAAADPMAAWVCLKRLSLGVMPCKC
eukprot:SAG22_NODE_209_length_15177_cov_9.282995_12_plen_344_part_00